MPSASRIEGSNEETNQPQIATEAASGHSTKKARLCAGSGVSPAKGRTVELVELIADTDYHCLSIRFKDKTDLSVVIGSMFTFRANFSDWKTHNQRVIKEWRTGPV